MSALDIEDSVARTPSSLLGDLFSAVAVMSIVLPKDWADAIPKSSPGRILQAFRNQPLETPAAMLAFVHQWFTLPANIVSAGQAASIEAYISATWPALIRQTGVGGSGGSLLPLPNASLAPGGRFREAYYWDTYFTLVGLRHRPDLVRASAENFRWQIEQYGLVPNANRSYYLSRSQPPFLFKIVELLAEFEGSKVVEEFLPALIAEHRFWMDGAEAQRNPGAFRRVVRLADDALLNRYWDDADQPRDESWLWDVETARAAPDRPASDVYRDIRAACESGWDFSSRWLAKANDFSSIITTSIIPSDLNSILFGLERFIAAGLIAQGDIVGGSRYSEFADRRRDAMCRHLWNAPLGAFDDLDWKAGRLRNNITAAAAAPLFFGLADADQASATASLIERHLLATGGLLTTTHLSDLQWDSPNGWAPLQWIAAEGLASYGFGAAAEEIRTRWLETVELVFRKTGRILEKYDVLNQAPGGGGEYVVQDGFGWTNGVTAAFLRAQDDVQTVAPVVR